MGKPRGMPEPYRGSMVYWPPSVIVIVGSLSISHGIYSTEQTFMSIRFTVTQVNSGFYVSWRLQELL